MFSTEAIVEVVNPDCEMDAGKIVLNLDCNTVTEMELQNFTASVDFKLMFPGDLHGFIAYFDVVFGPETVVMTTVRLFVTSAVESVANRWTLCRAQSPQAIATHWQQTSFYFDEPIKGADHVATTSFRSADTDCVACVVSQRAAKMTPCPQRLSRLAM
jgi:hypothetical protein